MTINLLLQSTEYKKLVRSERMLERRALVVQSLNRAYLLPPGARESLKKDLRKRGFSDDDTTIKNDRVLWRNAFLFLDDPEKRKTLEERAKQKNASIIYLGIRALIAEGVRTWGDFEEKWPELFAQIKSSEPKTTPTSRKKTAKKRPPAGAGVSPIPPENKNFLLMSETWKKKQNLLLPRYAAMLECVDEGYFLKQPIEEVIKTLANRGFPDLTEDALNHMVQQYRLVVRYFTTQDPKERAALDQRMEKKDSRTLGVRCLLEDEITWEQICAPVEQPKKPSAPEPLLALTPQDSDLLVKGFERLIAGNQTYQERVDALERLNASYAGELLQVRMKLEEVNRKLGEAQREIKRLEQRANALEAKQKEQAQMIQMADEEIGRHIREKEEIKVYTLEKIANSLSGEPYIRLVRIIEDLRKHNEAGKNERALPEGFPDKKLFADGKSVPVVYDPKKFWKSYDALPEAVKKKVPGTLAFLASPENELGTHAISLNTETIDRAYPTKFLGQFIGCEKSWIDLKYRIVWSNEPRGEPTERFVLYTIYAHGKVD